MGFQPGGTPGLGDLHTTFSVLILKIQEIDRIQHLYKKSQLKGEGPVRKFVHFSVKQTNGFK